MLAPGAIVTIAGREGHWAVLGLHTTAVPPNSRWRCIRDLPSGARHGYSAGAGSTTVVHNPTIAPGMVMRHWGEDVEVIADDGEHVRVRLPERPKRIGQRPNVVWVLRGGGIAAVARGALVAENMATFLKEIEG